MHHPIDRTPRPGPRKLARRAALLLTAGVLAGSSAWADCSLKQMEIPVRIVDRRPIATLTLNGTEVPMLVDSGAFYSMLPSSTAEQLKLPLRRLPFGMTIEGYTGRIEAKLTRVAKVGLLQAELSDVEFIVGGNELGAGIMGILGRNILAMSDTEYDLANGAVRISVPKGDCDKTMLAHWAGDAPVIALPLENEGNKRDTAIRVEVKVNGKRVQALLDTGAPATSLTLKAARRAGIEEQGMTVIGRVGGVGEGRSTSWTASVGQIDFGGEKISENRLQVDDVTSNEFGMLVGLDYFLSHRIYVSRLQGKVYATWNGGPVFALGTAKPGQYDTRYAALPGEIAPDNADALARRGSAALASGDLDRALADLDRACAAAPAVAEYRFLRARVRLSLRQPQPAMADLDEALRLDPSHAEARFHRASVRFGSGDRPGMEADLAQLDEALPRSAQLRGDMAELYATADQVPQALRQFELWMATHAKDARLASMLNNRCWMRARLNLELPLALEDCLAAVKQDRADPASRDSLGWTYLRLGDAAQAKNAFDVALELKTQAISLYGRALARAQLKDAAGAAADLAQARRIQPSVDDDVRLQKLPTAEAASATPAT